MRFRVSRFFAGKRCDLRYLGAGVMKKWKILGSGSFEKGKFEISVTFCYYSGCAPLQGWKISL